jgi:hypothetical protein
MSNKTSIRGSAEAQEKFIKGGNFFRLKQECSRTAFEQKRPVWERAALADFFLTGGLFCAGFFPILVCLRAFMADRRVNHLLENRKWQIPAIYAI